MKDYFTGADFTDDVVASIGDLECRIVILERGKGLSDAVCDLMERDGFEFYVSPAADKETGRRKVYFVRDKR
jgi:hypothetical protein